MARWDDLHRAFAARDNEGGERIWLELLETDPDAVDRFLEAARVLSEKPGGKRQAGLLLWMLAETLKEKGETRALISVFVHLARMAPDDGTVREALIEAARAAYPDREDLDGLLEQSGVLGGDPTGFATQAETLERYLLLEAGAFVFHRSGWGTGQVVRYLADRGRVVIDFREKPGHEMDIAAAAERLETLDAKDVRAMALSNPRGLRKWASEEPLEMLRQVISRFSGSAKLRHVKDALVPDAVATSRWSSWWKEAKQLAHLDPRYHVSPGRDPTIEYHDAAGADFRSQVERSFRGCASPEERQRAAREFIATAGDDVEAKEVLADLVEDEMQKATKRSTIIGWNLVLAVLRGEDERSVLRDVLVLTDDPMALVGTFSDDEIRATAARVLVENSEEMAQLVLEKTIEDDDPVLANMGIDSYAGAGHPEFVPLLLDRVDAKPALNPNLWAWYVRGLRRSRWDGRTYQPYALVTRLLKVVDAVEYRQRRSGSMRDKKGVSALCDLLTVKNGALVREAAEETDRSGARHLIMVLEKNRGIKGRALQKVTDIILRTRPDALRKEEVKVEGEIEVGERLDRIYMTAAGMEKLKAQLDHIVNEEMPANSKEIARAREFGDLSENAEYHAAREKQGLLQARADQFASDLARAMPLTADVVRTDAVSVGTRVHLKDAQEHEITYTLLGPPDADVKQGVINYLTPLGQALMGRAVGEHVEVELEHGNRDLEILAIENGLS